MRWIGVAYVQLRGVPHDLTINGAAGCCSLEFSCKSWALKVEAWAWEASSTWASRMQGVYSSGSCAKLVLQKCAQPEGWDNPSDRCHLTTLPVTPTQKSPYDPNAQTPEEGFPVVRPQEPSEQKDNSTKECQDSSSSNGESRHKPDAELNIGRMCCSRQ